MNKLTLVIVASLVSVSITVTAVFLWRSHTDKRSEHLDTLLGKNDKNKLTAADSYCGHGVADLLELLGSHSDMPDESREAIQKVLVLNASVSIGFFPEKIARADNPAKASEYIESLWTFHQHYMEMVSRLGLHLQSMRNPNIKHDAMQLIVDILDIQDEVVLTDAGEYDYDVMINIIKEHTMKAFRRVSANDGVAENVGQDKNDSNELKENEE